jgi:hypothetical protein
MTTPDATEPAVRSWTDITPVDAVNIDLTHRLDITAPLNENGERCPWPWEPQQLVGAPVGQYRCPYCMAMCVAGIPHIDYATEERTLTGANWREVYQWLMDQGEPVEIVLDAVDSPEALRLIAAEGAPAAREGDTIIRDGFGQFSVRPAVEGVQR